MICNKLVQGLPDILDDAKDFDCRACIQAKMMHSPFQAGHEVATKWLGCLHSDICGPMEILSLGKNCYFCTLIDDKTQYLWFLPCSKKSDFTAWLIHLDTFFANHYKSHTKILQMDHGGEYINTALETYCLEKGMSIELTILHTLVWMWSLYIP